TLPFAEVVRGDELLHVIACFFGKEPLQFPEIPASAALDGTVYTTGTAVVSGDYEQPVAVDIIKLVQVRTGCVSAFGEVLAFVDFAVHLQSHVAGGGGHELPGTNCTGP